jgi:NTP pyrophosphatase (non-canonical NTP hydrolase)
MTKELYRLKSNQTTIVTRLDDSNLQKIVWTLAMEKYGADSRWVSRFNPDNIIPLTEEETKEVMEKIKNFRKRL